MRGDKLGVAAPLDDPLGGLPMLVQFPVPAGIFIGRVQDWLFEELIGHRLIPLRVRQPCLASFYRAGSLDGIVLYRNDGSGMVAFWGSLPKSKQQVKQEFGFKQNFRCRRKTIA